MIATTTSQPSGYVTCSYNAKVHDVEELFIDYEELEMERYWQKLLKKLYHHSYVSVTPAQPLFHRRMLISISGFTGRAGKRKRSGK